MHTFGIVEARGNFGALLDTAQREPVAIEKRGRRVAVMVSPEEYDRLEALDEAIWSVKIQRALDEGFLGVEETRAFLERMEARHAKP